MTYYNEKYTLHNGKEIYALYDECNVCHVTKECMEMLIDLYQQGREDAIDEFVHKVKEKYPTDKNALYHLTLIAEELKAEGRREKND